MALFNRSTRDGDDQQAHPLPGGRPAAADADGHRAHSAAAALRAANRIALVCAVLFSLLVLTFAFLTLGVDVNAVERAAVVSGSLAGTIGFWAVYLLTRHARTVTDRDPDRPRQ